MLVDEVLLQCCPTVQTSDVHCCCFFYTLTLIDKCLAFYQHLSSIMCTSVIDQRSLHGGVETLVVFNHCFCGVATMYFQRVTERDSFQKRNGSRIRERTFHGQRFSTVGWQGVGCPVEDLCGQGNAIKRAWRKLRCTGPSRGKGKEMSKFGTACYCHRQRRRARRTSG